MNPDGTGFFAQGSEEEKLASQLDPAALPRHVAVIMDGNGRWAQRRHLARIEGHRAASQAVQDTIETCAQVGVRYVTLFAFSKENWKRPKREVNLLWKILEDYLKKEDKELVKNRFRLMVIGQRQAIPESTERELRRVEALTRDFDKLSIILALNYSGRSEIVDAVKKICRAGCAGVEHLDEAGFSRFLETASLPDPDLLIRTSGELRVSNFLLWQIAYAEIWITPVLWPDFRRKHLLEALVDYQKRERRFGAVHAQPAERS